jgi:hypothetical protein
MRREGIATNIAELPELPRAIIRLSRELISDLHGAST